MEQKSILSVKGLKTGFFNESGELLNEVVRGIDLEVYRGSICALVGESGSGKSVTSASIMNLLPRGGKITAGEVLLNGRSLKNLSEKEMEKIWGKEISMIYQDPIGVLNPVFRVGYQIREVLMSCKNMKRAEAASISRELLKSVGLQDADKVLRSYPHELSGGMCQRVMIAIGVANHPGLLIADEPTTALDVTVQAEILEELNRLRDTYNMAVLLITHDLGVVAEIADYIYVMKDGMIVEHGDVMEIFDHPRNPYTQTLMRAFF